MRADESFNARHRYHPTRHRPITPVHLRFQSIVTARWHSRVPSPNTGAFRRYLQASTG